MSINVSPADRELTAIGNYSKTAERAAIVRAKRAYLKSGGMIGVYRHGAAWDSPAGARRMLPHMNREVFAARAEYVAGLAARVAVAREEKAAKAAAARAEREGRAMAFNTADGREGPDGRPAMFAGEYY